MTPKEKAEELVNKFMNTFYRTQDFVWKSTAKQCALIAVNELIKHLLPASDFGGEINKHTIEYWEEVKQEIEKL